MFGIAGFDMSESSLESAAWYVVVWVYGPTFSKTLFGGTFHVVWFALPKFWIGAFCVFHMFSHFCRLFFVSGNSLKETPYLRIGHSNVLLAKKNVRSGLHLPLSSCDVNSSINQDVSGLVKADIEEWKRHSHLNPSFRNPGWATEQSPIVKWFQSWTSLEATGIRGVGGKYTFGMCVYCFLYLEQGWCFFWTHQWCIVMPKKFLPLVVGCWLLLLLLLLLLLVACCCCCCCCCC